MASQAPILYTGSNAGLRNQRSPPESALIRHSSAHGNEIMRAILRAFLAGVLLIGVHSAISIPSAWAQSLGSFSSLGGYGATPGNSMASLGGGPIIPYAGNLGGFMPYRMGGGSSLSFQSRGASAMASTRTSFSLSPMTGGMSSMSGSMDQGFGARTRAFGSLSSKTGLRPGGDTRQVMPGAGGMSVMPPNFGYPFYQPPSLLTPSASTGGISM
jgi:hypothetical protein